MPTMPDHSGSTSFVASGFADLVLWVPTDGTSSTQARLGSTPPYQIVHVRFASGRPRNVTFEDEAMHTKA